MEDVDDKVCEWQCRLREVGMEHVAVLKEKETWKRNITGEMGAIGGVFFM